MSEARKVSFGLRSRQHALATPDRTAIISIESDGSETKLSFRDLDRKATQTARRLQARGVGRNMIVGIALPDGVEHYITAIAAWRLGACVLPLNAAMAAGERDALMAVMRSRGVALIVGDWPVKERVIAGADFEEIFSCEAGDPIGDVTPQPGKAIASGGSTGRPKIIVDPKPWAHAPGEWGMLNKMGFRAGQTQLVAGRLHHNIGFMLGHIGLFEGHTLVVTPRFDADAALDLIERHRVQFVGLIPIMMQRMAKSAAFGARNLSSLEGVFHSGASCPDWVKRCWIERVGAEKIWETYGATEGNGTTLISGDEWLKHPGSVGRAYQSEIRIVGETGGEAPTGEIGEIYMRMARAGGGLLGDAKPDDRDYDYLGAERLRETSDGFSSVGDMGRLDADGFLYIADRRVDMIVTGGVNVYPAEVEAVLSAHPDVGDVVVIGAPDGEWGCRVHAIVEPAEWPSAVTVDDLNRFCRERITAYKTPKSYEFMKALPRDPSGKIRRPALREERAEGWTPAMTPVQRRMDSSATPAGETALRRGR